MLIQNINISNYAIRKIFVKITAVILSLFCVALSTQAQQASQQLSPQDVFNTGVPLIFKEDFRSGNFLKWTLSIDAIYDPAQRPTFSDRVQLVNAPGMDGRRAAKFTVPGTPGSFRAELALPAEEGLQERWYGERLAVQQVPTDQQGFIVMQWHAVMGNEKVDRNFPNLAIALKNDRWVINTAWGSPAAIQRSSQVLDEPAVAGEWVNWVVHAKWSTGSDGLLEIWRDGVRVWSRSGQNVYNLTIPRTPYFKTGIYRPSRNNDNALPEPPITVHVTEVRIGKGTAMYDEVSPVIDGTVFAGIDFEPLTDLGFDTNLGSVGFVVPSQAGVTGPTGLTWSGANTPAMLTVELTDIATGVKRPVRIRGYRDDSCAAQTGLVSMNDASTCYTARNSHLILTYVETDNPTLPAGHYQGSFTLEAQGWHDSGYRRTLELNADIETRPLDGVVRNGETFELSDQGPLAGYGSVAFVVPFQMGVMGPTSLVWDGPREPSAIKVTLINNATGLPYVANIRAGRSNSCYTRGMNDARTCSSNPRYSSLQLSFVRADNPDMRSGSYRGTAEIEARGWHDSSFRKTLEFGFDITVD